MTNGTFLWQFMFVDDGKFSSFLEHSTDIGAHIRAYTHPL